MLETSAFNGWVYGDEVVRHRAVRKQRDDIRSWLRWSVECMEEETVKRERRTTVHVSIESKNGSEVMYRESLNAYSFHNWAKKSLLDAISL